MRTFHSYLLRRRDGRFNLRAHSPSSTTPRRKQITVATSCTCSSRSGVFAGKVFTPHGSKFLFFVAEPTHRHGCYRITWNTIKAKGERKSCGIPPTNIRNARLVCKSFAGLGAAFLFDRLMICAHHTQLTRVEQVSQHRQFSKAVRTLVYDSSTYTNRWDTFVDGKPHDCESYILKFSCAGWRACERNEIFSPGDVQAARKRLYEEQEQILGSGWDTACLIHALPALSGVKKITCRPQFKAKHYRLHPGLASPNRRTYFPDTVQYQTRLVTRQCCPGAGRLYPR
ncbi:hypothetical protein B0J12DRAFT_365650 [Macrophomina phaseolina]|uniref:Uncharacterized protein n=1 Tax=Macrophomina phaseolina TaxID=35725 RepID=A0ABQ8FTA7_9PEZI|nr:hypothetical protein B0J12DRAFT_365650 [Macrophomina phaseolina]